MRSILTPLLKQFGKRYDYDVGYLQAVDRASPGVLWRYLLTTPLTMYRKHAPPAAYFAAKLTATRHYDCGPCARLVCNMALEAGVPRALLVDLLSDAEAELPPEIQQVVAFARAVVEQQPLQAEAPRQAIVRRWGEGALTDLSLAIAYGGFYPTLKRGLGQAEACAPVLAELRTSLASS